MCGYQCLCSNTLLRLAMLLHARGALYRLYRMILHALAQYPKLSRCKFLANMVNHRGSLVNLHLGGTGGVCSRSSPEASLKRPQRWTRAASCLENATYCLCAKCVVLSILCRADTLSRQTSPSCTAGRRISIEVSACWLRRLLLIGWACVPANILVGTPAISPEPD